MTTPFPSDSIFGMAQRVLIADHDAVRLQWYQGTLRQRQGMWDIVYCGSNVAAWDYLITEDFDAVVYDVDMPRERGLDFLSRVHSNSRLQKLAVILVARDESTAVREKAVELGAADFLVQPFSADDFYLRLRSVLRGQSYLRRLYLQTNELDELVNLRTAELNVSQIEMIIRLGKAAEFRDEETGNHVLRVGCYSKIVARQLQLDTKFAEQLFLAAPLHDIGKIGVPDSILLKRGRLTEEEWQLMKEHCAIGASILNGGGKLSRLCQKAKAAPLRVVPAVPENPILQLAATVALSHHEKWDGTGYPYGLAGNDIPLAARIVAICDVYDALRSERPYKDAFSVDKSLHILGDGAGRHFDPTVHSAFLLTLNDIRDVEEQLRDKQSAPREHEELEELEMVLA